jgi:hypothetical protein
MKTIFIANGNGLSDNSGGSITRTTNLAKKLGQNGHKVNFLTIIGEFKGCKRAALDVNYYLSFNFFNQSTVSKSLDVSCG